MTVNGGNILVRAAKSRTASVPPDDASDEEVARWLAETDLSELELEEVTRPSEAAPARAKGLTTVSLRLPGWEIDELRKRAERLGVGYTTYIRLLVNRHVLDEPPIR
jgi:predicted DNA binding CopG/RHH family protein